MHGSCNQATMRQARASMRVSSVMWVGAARWRYRAALNLTSMPTSVLPPTMRRSGCARFSASSAASVVGLISLRRCECVFYTPKTRKRVQPHYYCTPTLANRLPELASSQRLPATLSPAMED